MFNKVVTFVKANKAEVIKKTVIVAASVAGVALVAILGGGMLSNGEDAVVEPEAEEETTATEE